MELIRPSEVTSKIISLIEDAKENLIIVSPYNNIYKWNKLIKSFKETQSRKINISYYVRANEDHKGLELIGIQPIYVNDLHAKMYINEKYAIFSSMNLVKYSDDYSIDFAFKTETEEEYKEAVNFFESFIKEKAIPQKTDYQSRTPTIGLSQPKLNITIEEELPVYEYFRKNDEYFSKGTSLVKEYYEGTRFIKVLGHLKGRKKFGAWFHFQSNGLLEKVDYHWDEFRSENIKYEGKVGKYDLLFCVANIIGGLYHCSIEELFFNSTLEQYTKGDSQKLCEYLQKVLQLKELKNGTETVMKLTNDIYNNLKNQI